MHLPTFLAALAFLAAPAIAAEISGVNPQVLDTIAFGSCAREDRAQPIWDAIVAERPDLFLFLGDNVYADRPAPPETVGDIAAAYRELGKKPGYRRLREVCPVLATWDDHDYGKNDAGKEFRLKRESKTVMLSFFDEPAKSPRWGRDGVYGSWMFGPEGKRVQIILLDTRSFRDAITPDLSWRPGGAFGPFPPPAGKPGGTILGEQQWAWLGAQLAKPADLRLIGSSIQVVSGEHHWECWAHFPNEQRRLLRLIEQSRANGVVFLSGDRHLIELSKYDELLAPYPLWDFTSSGLNEPTAAAPAEPNPHRVGIAFRQANYGLIKVDWQSGTVTLEGHDGDGAELMSFRVRLTDLQVAAGEQR